ncbi:MAG TPA: hypothetical protein VFD77_03820 [Brumimicrobium sp.]|nr:hypothetical protein [Brumimicrobium sp.]
MHKLFQIFLMLQLFSSSLFSQTTEEIKQAKKQERIEKRFIHPQSKYISVSAGFGFTSTHIKDPNDFLMEGLLMTNNTYFFNVMYEHGIKNNFFAELAYNYIGQGMSMGRDMGDENTWTNYTNLYHNHEFQLGAGYRVINSNNFNFINLHAGIFIGFSNTKKSELPIPVGESPTYTIYESHTNHNYQIVRTIDSYSRLSIGPYLGVSKDIRLSEHVRLFIKYVHRFGLNANLKGTMVLSSDEMSFNDAATFKVRGGGAFVSGGLKIYLFNRKLIYND